MRYLALADLPKPIRCLFPTIGQARRGAIAPTRREQRRYRATALLLTLAISGCSLAPLLIFSGR